MKKTFSKKFYENKLFKGLSVEDIETVSGYFKLVEFAKDQVVIEENSCGDSMYLLLDGEVVVDKVLVSLFEEVEVKAEDKQIIPISSDKNLYFGEMSLFNANQKRSASIIAKSSILTAVINKTDFEKIVNEHQTIGVILLKNIILKLSAILDNSNNEMAKLRTAFTIALST
jgi:CRP-like cAMP-binding protein